MKLKFTLRKHIQFSGLASLLLLAVLLSCTAQSRENVPEPEKGPSRDALIDAYRQAGKLMFVYGTGDSASARQYRDLLTTMSAQKSRIAMTVRSDREVTDAELHAFPLYLVGTPQNNAVLKRLLPQLPFNVTEKSLEFNQQQYGDHPTLSIGFYPNPLAPGLPLSLTTGIAEADVYAYMQKTIGQRFFWYAISGWGYQLHDAGRRKVMGFFDESDPKQWRIGGKTHWDFSHDGERIQASNAFIFYSHQGKYAKALVDSIENDLHHGHDSVAAMLGKKRPSKPIEVHLYPSIELKGLATGDTRSASVGPDSSLHLVVHPEFASRPSAEPNLALIHQWMPPCKIPALELGLAIRPCGFWEGAGWQYWAQKFAVSGNGLTIAEMLNPEIWEHESPFLKACMSAALVEYIYSQMGPDVFRKLYAGEPDAVRQQLLPQEQQFQARLRIIAELTSYRDIREPDYSPVVPAFQKAFNFAHEGYQIFNGYASKEATLSMQYLAHDMHTNAVAIIPYAGYENVKSPSWLSFSEGAGAENDESIIHSIWSAKQAGMSVMLKPQVWPWNDWTGEIEMQNDADWALFFDHYYRWIRHYAIMAELYNVDLLCIGVEFSKATLQRPDDWRKMIQKLRGVYHGKITYAANWGEEFEQCKFWDALDYVGINCYYPLTKKGNPSQKELNAGFAEIVQKIEKVALNAKKPVLFTEIGFRSCTNAWENPHAEAEGRNPDPKCQEACYKAMIAGLEGKAWCKGVYLWKWPAYMDDAVYDPTGFTPLGKPAEQLVKDWFGEE